MTSLGTQLRTSNQSVLHLAANIVVGIVNTESEYQNNIDEGTSIELKKQVSV
jgi:hypothetical protein